MYSVYVFQHLENLGMLLGIACNTSVSKSVDINIGYNVDLIVGHPQNIIKKCRKCKGKWAPK